MQRQWLNDNFFENFFKSNHNEMKTDIFEGEDSYVFIVEVPGYKKDQIDLHIDNGYLIIETGKKGFKSSDESRYIRRERSTSITSRSYYVGEVDEKEIKANLKDGLLNVCVPLTSRTNKRQIEVHHSDN